MALNFPNNPGIGSVYTDSTSGFSYQWDGTVWKSYAAATASNIQILDDISSSFNGSTLTFALTSGGTAVYPVNAQQLDINLGGVIQSPGVDYTISSSNITFTGPAPTAGLTFSGKLLGTGLSLSTISDGLVTPAKLSTGGPTWNTGGDLRVTGVTTSSGGFVGALTGNVTGNISGNINSSGVSTFVSVRATNINATGVTTSSGGFVGALTGNATGLSGTPNITVGTIGATSLNATGFITATEYDITGSTNTLNSSGLNVGVITATRVVVGSAVTITTNGLNTVGVITANDYDGNFILDSYLFN